MIKAILSDFSRVILFPKDKTYAGSLNSLNKELIAKLGNDYPFLEYFEFNSELLNLYKWLKSKYNLYIFTSDTIQERPEAQLMLKPIFTEIFSAKDYSITKSESKSYLFLANKVNIKPDEILYVDDQEVNIKAAQEAGMQTILYKSIESLSSLRDPSFHSG